MLCLDSWAYERQFLMTTKPRGFGLKGLEGQSDIKTLSLSERYLSQVQGRQTQHYQDLAHLIEQQGGLFERVRWPAVLPTDSHDPTGALFRQILQDLPLFRLWAGR